MTHPPARGVARERTRRVVATLDRQLEGVRVVRELPGTATVDGDNALGLVVGPRAKAVAMETRRRAQAAEGWPAERVWSGYCASTG